MTFIDDALNNARRTGDFTLEDRTIDRLPHALLDIPDLQMFRLNRCRIIKGLPDWFGQLRIRWLDLLGCELTEFPRAVLDMQELRDLGLSSNDMGPLPEDISRLASLENLAIPYCQMKSIPESIRGLTRLTALDLGLNSFTDSSTLFLPPRLRHLILSGNRLSTVPEAVRGLTDLRVLEFSSGAAGGTDYELENLRPRRQLPGFFSRATGIGNGTRSVCELPEWLFEMPDLEWLNFTGQMIRDIPDSVEKLRNLQGLVLVGNELRRVPKAVFTLASLRVLSLEKNAIDELPADLPATSPLTYLGLGDNRLPIPPEVLARADTPAAIWAYIAGTRGSRRPLDEAKLLVVGEGSVGKSSLIRRLTHGDFDPDERKTEGIDVTHWSLSVAEVDIAVNLWDFGGQEIMHATHQFFLTRRSVYFLVVDARQSEEQNRVEYWLKLIQGFSGGSPVILVGNKCEEFGLDIDQRGLRLKYPDIVDIVETSCAGNRGIDTLLESLRRTVGGLAHVRDLLPTSFFAVKEYLEELDRDYLPFADYEELCLERGVVTASAQELLIGFLHDLGTVLCFRRDPRLRDTNILNPSWVTGGVYRLLNSNVAAQAKGLLTWREIDQILDADQYPADKRQFIMDMMEKFELCYESDDVFLVPDLLTKEEPDTGSWDDALHFAVGYEVLPSSIIGRLVVRLRELISQGTVWRTGVVLALDNNRALVKADREDAVLTIKVSGPATSRRGLLTAIRAELRTIERTIPGLTGEERVPVPGHPQVWVPYTHLLNLESAGKNTVVPQGLVDEFPISRLLEGVETRADRTLTRSVPETRPIDEKMPELEPEPAGAVDGGAWTPRNALLLGGFLLVTVVVVVAAYIVADQMLGSAAGGATATLALAAVVIIALIVLRTAGRIGEKTLLDGLKEAFSATAKGKEDP